MTANNMFYDEFLTFNLLLLFGYGPKLPRL